MYKKAAQANLMFAVGAVTISVAALWKLPLTTKDPNGISLDRLATELQEKITTNAKGSYLSANKGVNELDQLRFDIVKDVIEDVQFEQLAKEDALVRQTAAQKAKAELAKRKEKSFETMTDAQLEAIANGK